MSHSALASFAALMLTAGAALAEDPFIRLPDQPGPVPVVVVLPDADASERRMALQLDLLAEAGIATLRPAEAADADTLAALLAMAASDPRFDGARVAILGFGDGARMALEAGAGHAVAAVLPGCKPLRAAHGPARDVLLLDHPDPSEACATFRAVLGPGAMHHTELAAAGVQDGASGAMSADAAARIVAFMREALDRALQDQP